MYWKYVQYMHAVLTICCHILHEVNTLVVKDIFWLPYTCRNRVNKAYLYKEFTRSLWIMSSNRRFCTKSSKKLSVQRPVSLLVHQAQSRPVNTTPHPTGSQLMTAAPKCTCSSYTDTYVGRRSAGTLPPQVTSGGIIPNFFLIGPFISSDSASFWVTPRWCLAKFLQ